MSKATLNLAVIGHLASGKENLLDQLSFLIADISKNPLARSERQDSDAPSILRLENSKFDVRILKNNNHLYNNCSDLIKDATLGVSTVDATVLVASGETGEFDDDSYFKGGNTDPGLNKEQFMITKNFGARQLIVAVNQMDKHGYSQWKFNDIKDNVLRYLSKFGQNTDRVTFIPVSSYACDNLTTRSSAMEWYKGPTMLDAIKFLELPYIKENRPLRIPVKDVYLVKGVGTVPVGKVEAGVIRQGMIAHFAPSNVDTEVKSVEHERSQASEGVRGMSVGFNIKNASVQDIKRGYVASDKDNNPAKETINFSCVLVSTNMCRGGLREGFTPIINCHTARIACKITSIYAKVDKYTGKTIEANPIVIKEGEVCHATLTPQKPMCVEAFSEYPELGRFYVSDFGDVIAYGVIKKVFKRDF